MAYKYQLCDKAWEVVSNLSSQESNHNCLYLAAGHR